MKKKILVTGSNGMLGQKLVHALAGNPRWSLYACARGENLVKRKDGYMYLNLDISDREQVMKVMDEVKPHVVINTAAMTNVDACETKREECVKANVDGVRNIVDALEAAGKKEAGAGVPHLIQVSTDFVFDGEKGPYREEDEPNPVSYYAWSKLEGENIVRRSSLKWSIARTIIVYAVSDNSQRSNMVLWVKGSLEKGQKINVVNDQFRCPTLAEDLALGCISIAEKEAGGIYHLSGPEMMSMLEMAYRIADFWNLDRTLIHSVSSVSLNQPAKRPPRTGFILDKARKELGYAPRTLEEGLKVIDQQLKGLRA